MLAELMSCAKANGAKANEATAARSLDTTDRQAAATAPPVPVAAPPAVAIVKPNERRVALVIGNSAYRFAPKLENQKTTPPI